MNGNLLILTVAPNKTEHYPKEINASKRQWVIQIFEEQNEECEEAALLTAVEYILQHVDDNYEIYLEKTSNNSIRTLSDLNKILEENNWHIDSGHVPWQANFYSEIKCKAKICFELIPFKNGVFQDLNDQIGVEL